MSKFVAFDLDDTLYKEKDFVKSAHNHISLILSKKYNQPYDNLLSILQKNTKPFNKLSETIQSFGGKEDISWLLNEYRYHIPNLLLATNVENSLIQLKDNNISMGIITDGRKISQYNKIYALGLLKFINKNNIIISEEIGYEKHFVNGFKLIMSLNPNCNKFYYVGDNLSKDFFWPNQLGWTTICLKDNGQNIHKQNFNIDKEYLPQHIIHNFSEIIPLIL